MANIWIDGDACPKPVKDILFKAAIRTRTPCHIVANQLMTVPSSPFIKRILAEKSFDSADRLIEHSVQAGDIVVTSDLPLVEACLEKQAAVISPKGELFSLNSIKQKLAMRDFNEVMRGSGIHTGGPKPLSAKDISLFANQLDRLLAKRSL